MSGLDHYAHRIFGWFSSMASRITRMLSLTRRVPIPGAGEVFPRKTAEQEKATPSTQEKDQPLNASEGTESMKPALETKTRPATEGAIHIGRSVLIKGELTGDENLTVDGRVEGRIELQDHHLTVGPNAEIKAEINARNVTVSGSVVGNISASELVEIKSTGSLAGNIKCVQLSIADGAQFRGSVEMERGSDTPEKFDPNKAEPDHNPSAGRISRAASFGLRSKLRVQLEEPSRAAGPAIPGRGLLVFRIIKSWYSLDSS